MSWFPVRNHADEWRAILAGNPPAKPDANDDEVDTTVPAVAEGIAQTTRDFILKELSRQLKGHPFSWFVAHRDELAFEPPIVRVQVTSGAGAVGHSEVAFQLGTLAHSEFGLLVTLAPFTGPARTFAGAKPNLRLVDGDDLVDLVRAHDETFDFRDKGLLPRKRVYVLEPDPGGRD